MALSAGNYIIHTLVYDPTTLDLSTVILGTTTGFDVNALLIQGGGTVCGALDVGGASFVVEDCGGNNTCNISSGVITLASTNYCTTDNVDFGATTSSFP